VETNGSQNKTIPLTHPWRVQNISFSRPESIVGQYEQIKQQENADLYIALTHLGHDAWNTSYLGDFDLAMQFPYFDAIIGGHTNQLLDTVVNSIPVFQAGFNLNHLGKIKLKVQNKKVISHSYELIDLNIFPNFDPKLKSAIEIYNNSLPELDDVIGHSEIFHTSREVGCFYTDALKKQMKVDFALQNSGGVRDDLDQGDILKKEIYAISPFNNGTIVYEMTVGEIKQLLKESASGFYYSGLNLEQVGQEIVVRDSSGQILEDSDRVTLGTNDYIPAVDNEFFPVSGTLKDLTDAETIINYLQANPEPVNYPTCERYFRYQ
jgi:2',3'-cyclic-nucleotide 2'-phosphodiesterase (5'-nucleotidase family)